MNENKIIPYIEPIFRFCCKRLSNRYDAEDLSSEIICHILAGMKKYKIQSFDAWVWRIAHNRYARFIHARNKAQMILTENETLFDIADSDYCYIDEESTEQEFEKIFRYLHTLSSEYRNIFIRSGKNTRDFSRECSCHDIVSIWRNLYVDAVLHCATKKLNCLKSLKLN